MNARERLAGFWNAWFSRSEIDQAHALAQVATEKQCRDELERLAKVRDERLQAWSNAQ